MDTLQIYVENHYGVDREIFILIRFDNMRLGERGSPPHLCEDPLISETCPLEENASHHLISRNHISLDLQDYVRNVDPGPHVHSDSEPGVNTVGIYVENHEGTNRECFIWIRFDF